jgi:hypothetical protein
LWEGDGKQVVLVKAPDRGWKIALPMGKVNEEASMGASGVVVQD